ncbi:cationic amino acid transporter 3-like [Brevipalpus obovatus]|uniref:cationic amino acid transporter 3-like n=1 Tax=Brevipalpus obovatus TaxID=246614 RepID=UPI003D9E4082
MSMVLRKFFQALIRRKPIEEDADQKTRLVRCLNTFDLTALGIGSTLGLGVYVLAGHVAYKQAGPSVILSFVIAAIASVFAGLCYAEFGARVPKAGSAYVYSYTTVGEFMAFIIGWNLILEYVIGTASVARGYSGYVDTLIDDRIANYFNSTMPLDIPGASTFFDMFAFGLTVLVAVILAFGVKESTGFTAVFTVVNLYAVFYCIIAGSFRADFDNWFIPKEKVPPGFGNGGFFPYGFKGMMSGAATCFYGFVGFDAIASTGEESKNPQKSIPMSISISLLFILMAYLGVAGVSTLMAPYWTQGSNAPLTDIFSSGPSFWIGSKYIITFGAITSLTTALLGSLFPLPRVLFAMSSDGLLPPCFKSTVGAKKTPVFSTLFSGIFSGIMAALFSTDELTDMMSIGTLLAYTLVAISVLILRYREDPDDSKVINYEHDQMEDQIYDYSEHEIIVPILEEQNFLQLAFNTKGNQIATESTARTSNILIGIIVLLCLAIDGCLALFLDELLRRDTLIISIISVLIFFLVFLIILLYRQPMAKTKLSFKVPWLPLLPIVSAIFNFYLMYNLSKRTWYRFLVWMTVGLSTYFLYSIWNSTGYSTTRDISNCPSESSDKGSGDSNETLPCDSKTGTIEVSP